MAKLPRVTQKIFANSAPANQVTAFGSIKAGSPVYTKNISSIMNTNYDSGWSDAVEDDYAPYRQDRNALDLSITQQIAYILQEGIAEWDAGTTYFKNSIVKVTDGNNAKIYKSIVDTNTSALTDTTKWVLFLTIDNSGNLVNTKLSSATLSNPTMTGTVTVPTPDASDSSTKAASTAFIQNKLTNYMDLSTNQTAAGVKTFSSSPLVPTVSVSDDSTKSASTGYVKDCVPKSRGSGTKHVYTNSSGVITASTSTVGSVSQPVYMNSGTITACTVEEVPVVIMEDNNGSDGYRLWSNGTLEEWGGYSFTSANTFEKVSFQKTFADTTYTVQVTQKGSNNTTFYNVKAGDTSVNEVDGFKACCSNASGSIWWYVRGKAAV